MINVQEEKNKKYSESFEMGLMLLAVLEGDEDGDIETLDHHRS